jgi:AcrR family transcriptional regulator
MPAGSTARRGARGREQRPGVALVAPELRVRGGGAGEQLALVRAADRPRGHSGTADAEASIFDATERLLADTPLSSLSVAQIIAAAGVSRATFYFYFSSKFAVISGLLARVMDEIFQVITPYTQRAEDVSPQEALRQSLMAGVSMWVRHRPALRAIHEHWNSTDELRAMWSAAVARFTEAVAAEIERERAAGLIAPTAPSEALAAALLWATDRCLYVSCLGVDTSLPDPQAVLAPLEAMWIGAIYGAPAAG